MFRDGLAINVPDDAIVVDLISRVKHAAFDASIPIQRNGQGYLFQAVQRGTRMQMPILVADAAPFVIKTDFVKDIAFVDACRVTEAVYRQAKLPLVPP